MNTDGLTNKLICLNNSLQNKEVDVKIKCEPTTTSVISCNLEDILRHNYTLPQLKMVARNLKIKIGGNKQQVKDRICEYLRLSVSSTKIQKNCRGLLARKYATLHGPAYIKRNLCTNIDDFVTMEPLININFHQFISYKDVDGFIYGFDIISLHRLISQSKPNEQTLNPYNRNVVPDTINHTVKSILRLGKILKFPINLKYDDELNVVSNEKTIEFKALEIFQTINGLGNYSNHLWFLSLNKHNLIKFVFELHDVWHYRANLSIQIKREICPPFGDPFVNYNLERMREENNIFNIKSEVLKIIDKFVNSAITNDNKSLGSYYVLGALTLVNIDAYNALPWLFESFTHN